MRHLCSSQRFVLYLSIPGAGLVAALVALGSAALIFGALFKMDSPVPNVFSAVVSMALSSMACWWWVVVHPRRVTPRRGAVAGLISLYVGVALLWGAWTP